MDTVKYTEGQHSIKVTMTSITVDSSFGRNRGHPSLLISSIMVSFHCFYSAVVGLKGNSPIKMEQHRQNRDQLFLVILIPLLQELQKHVL